MANECDCGADRTGPSAEAHDASCATNKPLVNMVSVRSSNIAELGYDEPASELHVRFLKADKTPSENVYIYPGVPKEVYQLLCRDDVPYNFSVGKEFDRHVKKVVDPKLVRKVVR